MLAYATALCCTVACPANDQSGDPGETAFRKAVVDFNAAAQASPGSPQAREAYRRAADGFQSLVDAGVRNGRLYYNLANAHARLGNVGQAILNYRRAERLLPGDPWIRSNLESARKMCTVRIDEPVTTSFLRTLMIWHYESSRVTRLRVFLGVYAAFWMLMLGPMVIRRRWAAVTWGARVCGLVALIVGASLTWESLVQSRQAEGVILAREATLRKGNGAHYEPVLTRPLSEGVEFRLLEMRTDAAGEDWYHVQLRDARDGWLRADETELL